MNVKVAEYREQIRHLERVINYDSKMCVGEKEIASCVRIAKSVGSALIDMECRTAKDEDDLRKECILDKSFHFIYKNTSLLTM